MSQESAYLPRIVDAELRDRLSATGAVVIEGPKACGKTATARRATASEVLLDVDRLAREAIAIDPMLVLEGATPRLIDEWQLEPELWNHIRRTIDDRGDPGQFVLTGSAVPADDISRHTGAGRIARMRMRPMSLFEAGSSNGELSLAALLSGESARCGDPGLDVTRIAEEICVGGWPGQRDLPVDRAMRAVRDYLEEVRRVDVGRLEGKRRDPERVGRLLRSLARNVATHVSTTTLARDTGGADEPLQPATVSDYLDALTRLMIVEDQPAWVPHMRSRYALRSAAKRHFTDPSLAAAAVRASPDRLLRDLRSLGLLFESLVVRDLRAYAQACDANVLQFRDSSGLEVDTVVEAADGRWAAFEVKLGPGQVEEGAATLKRFAERVDLGRCGEPSALGVIVGSGLGFRRPDGVDVIPIGALGP